MARDKDTPRSFESIDVEVVSENSETHRSFDYFFSRVFHYRTRIVSNTRDAKDLLMREDPSRLWILRLTQLDDATLDLIATASFLKYRPFIIALTLDPKSEMASILFESGVDDVWRLPITLREFAYRLRSRSNSIGLQFDFEANHTQTFDVVAEIALRADLTEIEARVFRILFENEGHTVSRGQLSQSIDKTTWDYGDRKFDVHVSRIRKKIRKVSCVSPTLKTIRSVGYQLKLENHDVAGYNQQI